MNFHNYIKQGIDQRTNMLNDSILIGKINLLVEDLVAAFNLGNKVLFAGNGGSAADAQHLSAEFVSRFRFDRPGLASISLSTDTSSITAIGNDYGFENLFSRQIQALGKKNDVFVGISTSGKSPNILNGLNMALETGMNTYLLTGSHDVSLPKDVQVINVPSNETCLIQEMHITIGHYLCGSVENKIFA